MFVHIFKKRIRQFLESLHQLQGTRPIKIYYGSLLAGWFLWQIGKDGYFEYQRRIKEKADRRRVLRVIGQGLSVTSNFDNAQPHPKPLFRGRRGGRGEVIGVADASDFAFSMQQVRLIPEIQKAVKARKTKFAYLQKMLVVKTSTDLSAVGFAVKQVPEYQSPWDVFACRVFRQAVLMANFLSLNLSKGQKIVISAARLGASWLRQQSYAVKNAAVSLYFALKRFVLALKVQVISYKSLVISFSRRSLAKIRQWLTILAVLARDFARNLFYTGQSAISAAKTGAAAAVRFLFTTGIQTAVLASRLGACASQKIADFSLRLYRFSVLLTYRFAEKIRLLVQKMGVVYLWAAQILTQMATRILTQITVFIVFLRLWIINNAIRGIEYLKIAVPKAVVFSKAWVKVMASAGLEGLLGLLWSISIYLDSLKRALSRLWAILSIISFKFYEQGRICALWLENKVQFALQSALLSFDITATYLRKQAQAIFTIAAGYGLKYGGLAYKGGVYLFTAIYQASANVLGRTYERILDYYYLLRPPAPPGRWHYTSLRFWFAHQKHRIFSQSRGGLGWNWRRTLASAVVALLLMIQSAPVVAETIEITDSSITPGNPVLQQEATVTSNVQDLLQNIVKRVEEFVKPSTDAQIGTDNTDVSNNQPSPLIPSPAPVADSGTGQAPVPVSASGGSGTGQADPVVPILDANQATSTPPSATTTPDSTASTTPNTVASTTPQSTGSVVPSGQTVPQCTPKTNDSGNQGSSVSTDTQIQADNTDNEGQIFDPLNPLPPLDPISPIPDANQATSTPPVSTTTLDQILPTDASSNTENNQLVESPPDCAGSQNQTSQNQAGQEGLVSAPAGNQEITDGDGNKLDIKGKTENLIEIINTNSIKVVNEVKGEAVTGINAIKAGGGGKDAAIDTGDINVFANVLNVVNTNLINSKIVEIAENFNNLSADVLLNHPETTPSEVAQDLVSQICGVNVSCQSLNSFTLTNQNTAEVENNVDVFGQSGQNLLEGIEKRGTIRSGDVNALVNILNIVNTNLINSRWTIVSINIFGDFKGDLVLPSELYFTDAMSIGVSGDSQLDVEQIEKVLINVQNDNEVEVVNNVDTASDSGLNAIEATGTPAGKKGEINNSEIGTGESRGESNIHNVVNTNVLNGKWYLGMVNTLGAWAGNVFALPEQVAMGTTPTGLTFFSSSAKDNDLTYKLFGDTVAKINQEHETQININNDNDAKITNNVDLGAFSGENAVRAEEVEESGIFSGNTYALANILNFANTNLINADLQVGLVNVFGKWDGNIVFGFPDLAVRQALAQGKFPKEKKSAVAYELSYENKGDASMIAVGLEWHYDPAILQVLGSDAPYTKVEPGIITFDLDKVGPRANGKITVRGKTLRALQAGDEVSSYARISGIGAEREKANNEMVFNARAEDTGGIYVIPDPLPPPASGGGSAGGGSSGNNSSGPGGSGSAGGGSSGSGGNNSGSSSQDNNQNSGNGQAGGTDANGGNGSGGAQNQQSSPPAQTNGGGQQAQYTSPLRVILDNSAGSASLKPGQRVAFTLTVGNAGQTQLYNIVLYSQIRGPDNKVVVAKQFPFNKLLGEEGVEITYELEVTDITPTGVYTNSAYAEAVTYNFQKIKSNTAISAFTVTNPKSASLAQAAQPGLEAAVLKSAGSEDKGGLADNELNELVDGQKPAADNSSQIEVQAGPIANSTSTQPLVMSNVKGVKTSKPASLLRSTPSAAVKTAQEAEAGVFDEIIIPALQRDAENQSPLDQLITIVFVCFLIALGYALSNLRQRFKASRRSDD